MDIKIRDDGRIECSETGLLIDVSYNRHGVKITFYAPNGQNLFAYIVNQDSRPLTDEEKKLHPLIRCPNVVIWRLITGGLSDNILPGVVKTNDFVADFLRSYQRANGYGCTINGERLDALVEVVMPAPNKRYFPGE